MRELERRKELSNCPFCGKEANIIYTQSKKENYLFVYCTACGIRTPYIYYIQEERCDAENTAINKWNRRAET